MTPIDNQTIELVIQGGAVGLALAALGIVFYVVRALINHLPHIANTMKEVLGEMRAMRRENREWHEK